MANLDNESFSEFLRTTASAAGLVIQVSKGPDDRRTGQSSTIIVVIHPTKGEICKFYLSNIETPGLKEQISREIQSGLRAASLQF